MNPITTTSKTIKYMIQRIPKTSHHKWGDVRLQVLKDVYTRIWAVRNQLKVSSDERTETLDNRSVLTHGSRARGAPSV
jgi:hypothetical protein